uniref:Uncharacterized protein n=1 Tax=Erythrolobus madagascarensis TaxID=708628 RepID=A0A7S0T533_9RHOD
MGGGDGGEHKMELFIDLSRLEAGAVESEKKSRSKTRSPLSSRCAKNREHAPERNSGHLFHRFSEGDQKIRGVLSENGLVASSYRPNVQVTSELQSSSVAMHSPAKPKSSAFEIQKQT